MKLHLPTRLRAAVLACFAVVTSFTTTLATGVLAGGAFAVAIAGSQASALTAKVADIVIDTSGTYDANGYTYSNGVLTGADTRDLTFDYRYSSVTTAGALIYVGTGGYAFGLYAEADGGITGGYGNPFVAFSGNDNAADPGTVAVSVIASQDTEDTGSVRLTTWLNGKSDLGQRGTFLAVGDDITARNEDVNADNTTSDTEGIWLASKGLFSGSADHSQVTVNADYISRIYVTDPNGATTYTSNGKSIVLAAGEHVNVTDSEVMYTGGDDGTYVPVNAARKPIFVGGSGLLFLQTWSDGSISLDNDIYVGSSSHGSYATRGAIDFGNDYSEAHTTTLNGVVYILEDTKFRSRGQFPVNIVGGITDKKYIDGTASAGGTTLTITGKGYNISGNVDLTKVQMQGAAISMSGAASRIAELSADADSTLSLTGGNLSIIGVSSVSGTVNVAAANALTVAWGGSLTLGGTVALSAFIENAGEISFNSSVQLDLSGLTAESGVYTVFTGEASDSFATLTADNIVGIQTIGYEWTFAADGTISYVVSPTAVVYNGGTLSWDTVSASFADNKIFTTGADVIFNGNAEVSLSENITAGGVLINTDAVVELRGDSYSLSADKVMVKGELSLESAGVLAASTVITGKGALHVNADYTTGDTTWMGYGGALTVGSSATLTMNAGDERKNGAFASVTVDGTLDVSSGYISVSDGVVINNGGRVYLRENLGGDYPGAGGGAIQGTVTVKNGGRLKFLAKDITGWGGSRLSALTIEEGGELVLSIGGNHETFQGTLRLDGAILDDTENAGVSEWYMHSGSQLFTGDGKNAVITTRFKIGRDDAPISVGTNSTLRIEGELCKDASTGNRKIRKQGGGLLLVEGSVSGGVGFQLDAGTLRLTGGGTLGIFELRAPNTGLVFDGQTTYAVDQILTNSGDYFTRDITVTKGTTVNAAAFANSWGIGTLLVDGELTTTGEFKMATAANSTGNLITGSGVITVGSLRLGHDGQTDKTYFDIRQFTVTGNTLVKKKSYVQGGVLNLNGAVTLNGDIEISGGELNIDGMVTGTNNSILLLGGSFNLTTDDENNATSIGRVQVLEGKGGSVNIGGAGNTIVALNSYAGSTTITGTGVSMTHFRTKAGASAAIEAGADVTATNLELGAPIVNKGSLTFSTLKIDSLSGFRMTAGAGATYDDGNAETQNDVNGYLTGSALYEIIQNSGTINDDTVTLSGAAVAGAEYADGVLTVSSTDTSTYWVNTTVNAAAALGDGKSYRLNGGSSVLNVTADAENVLCTTQGVEGTIVLQTNATLTDGAATVFCGNLEIASGAKLSLGSDQVGTNVDGTDIVTKVASISSFTSTTLNGGTLFVRGVEGNLGTIITKENSTGSVLQLYGMTGDGMTGDGMTGDGKTTDKRISMEALRLNADLSMPCNFRNNIDIANLSGSGNLMSQHYFRNSGNRENCYGDVNLNINSLADYSGAIRLIGGDGNLDCAFTMNVSTGNEAVNMRGISLTTATMNLEVTGALKLMEETGLALVGQHNQMSTAAIAILDGGSWDGAVTVTGGTSANKHSLTSTAGGMNLSRLNVAANAYLDLNGAVSALLMNQAGTVDTAGMSLTDGAVLTYGNAANLLSVTDDMLAGSVVIGTGLTLTDAGVNLGLSSAIAQEKINIGNYNDSVLEVVGDTWYLKALVERYYYESPTDTYWSNAIWSRVDDDTSNTVSLPADSSNVAIVFSDAGTQTAPILLKLNNPKTVRILEVVNGYYEFKQDNAQQNGSITCTEKLVLGADGHLKQNLSINAVNLSMAADSSLEIGKSLRLSGSVYVTGEGAAISLGSGQSLTTSGLSISGTGSTLSLTGLSGAGAAQSLGAVSLGDNTTLTLKDGATDITATATSVSLGSNAQIKLEAGQVLDLTAYNYGGKGGQWAALLKAVSGAGTLSLKADATGGVNEVIQPGEAVAIATNVEMSRLKLNYNRAGGTKTLTIGSNGSLTVGDTPDDAAVPTVTGDVGADGVLISESGATVKVDGGSLSAEHIMLGHDSENNDGHLRMTSTATGSITTGSITLNNANDDACTFTMEGGTLTITSTAGIGAGVVTSISGGTLVAPDASGWGMTNASVGGAAVSADSAGKVTMTNTTVTADITGNDKLALAGTANATSTATVSGASVGGITVTTTDANKLTLNNTTIGSTITNNGTLEFSGTQNVTLAGSSATKYTDVYGSTTYGDNGYKSTLDTYTLVSGTAATAASDTIWQVNGVALSSTPTFDGKVLTHITEDAAGKVYYINSGSVEYTTGAGCTAAEKLQLTGGKLVMSKELDSTVPTGGITVTGSSTTLELKTELAANKLSMGTGAATVLMGDGTLNLGTGTALASGISLGTETDAKWAGTVKVTGAALSDANLGALGVTGSTIELDDTDGTLKGGTYAAGVELTNGSAVVLGSNNSFASLDAGGGSLSIAGVGNIITTLTMANDATLELNLSALGVTDLGNWDEGPMLTVSTLNTATPGGKLNVSAQVSEVAMLTLVNGNSKVLATITNCNAALDALKLNGLEEQVLTGIGGMEYKYTLERVDGTNEVNLIVKASNTKDGWVAADSDPHSIADTTWTDADTADDVKWAGVVGSFYGKGNATVHIEEDGVTMDAVDEHGNPVGVIVSADANLDVSEYTFTGGMLNTSLLAVNQGGLVLDNAGVNAGMYVILSNDAKLKVNADTALTVGTEQGAEDGAGMMGAFVSVGGKAALINEGTTAIHGTLSVADTAAVSNSGMLSVDAVSAEGSTIHNTGKFIVAGGGIIGKLTGEGALENVGQLSVLSDTTLGSLTNSGTLSVSGNLAVNSAVTQGGTVTATNVTVNGDAAFTALTTGKLTADSLTVKDATITTLDTDKLTVTDKGMVMVSSAATLSSLSNKGSLEVVGNLAVNSAVTQGGTVTATNVTVNGDAAFTALTTGKLTAGSLTVKDATITTLDTDKLTVGGGTVAVTNDVTLAALSGSGTLNAVGKVSLTSSVDTKVNVSAAEIELADGGNSLGSLCTDAITMPEGSKLSTESALLTVNSVSSLSGAAIGIDVSESAFAALDILADGRYVAGNYLLIDGADSAAMFTYVNGQHLDAIIATGMNAGLTVNNGVLSLSVSEITNENGEVVGMVWDTTNGNTTTNNGVGIDTDAGFYKALDYVKQVLVTEDVTFDLSADSVGDSVAGNTSDPVSGLLIRNLSGSGELTIKGNAAAQDVATLMNTPGREISAVGLTADAATVNLGLPKGAEGYLLSDLSSTGPTLKSLNLVNRSVVNVNSNTEVLGDTDVADYTRLSVKEGNMLTTGMLSGTDEAEISGVITVRKGGVYTGSYDEATLVADSGSNLRLRTGARRSMSLQVNADGQVTLDSAAQDGSMDNLRVGESPMARAMSVGSATLNLLNTAVTDDGINHSTITLTEDEGNYINKSVVTLSLGAAETARTLSSPGSPVVIDGMVDVLNSSITVNMLGNSVKNGVLEVNTESDKNLTLARFVTGGHVEGNTVTLTGTPEMKALLEKYYTNARLDSKGNIKVDRVTDYYGSRMQLSDNARVGIDMADAALVKLNPQANRGSYKDLADVLDTLDTAVATGNKQSADELGAAVSGASVAAMGAAVAGDVERQLMGIRNRTTTMGVDQTQVNENMPYFNAWINAEGDFRRMDEDGTAAGYELSSWGGTVGFDVDMTSRLTMGLAATAMYGDFTAKSADHAEGDLDTYYVTAFARYAANRWSHTFVATAGMADTSLKRTVSHAGGSYSTEGDAEAVSFGFLYELGYVVAMNESATACLQPVFNVMLSHSSLDGYSEEGSDAALKMGGVDMTTVTFGMGARAQAIVGANLYNRSSMVEGRALLKVRTGDTEAEAENALGAVPGAMGSVKAAEMGSIGAELGVGITVPMGATGGSIFADASLEVGSGYTNINGTVGYRINF